MGFSEIVKGHLFYLNVSTMANEFVVKISDNYVDLSQIKSFRIAHATHGDKVKRRIEIQLKDRILFVNGNRDDKEILHDTININFETQDLAQEWCQVLSDAWEQFIKDNYSPSK